MKVNWPSAAVLIVVIVASAAIAAFGKETPDWLKELMVIVGPVVLAFMRAVVAPIPPDEKDTDPQIRVPR